MKNSLRIIVFELLIIKSKAMHIQELFFFPCRYPENMRNIQAMRCGFKLSPTPEVKRRDVEEIQTRVRYIFSVSYFCLMDVS